MIITPDHLFIYFSEGYLSIFLQVVNESKAETAVIFSNKQYYKQTECSLKYVP